MPCPICGSPVKNPKTASHIRTKRHQAALKRRKRPGVEVEPSIPRLAPSRDFESRLSTIENNLQRLSGKVDFLVDEMSVIQKKLAGSTVPKSTKEGLSSYSQVFLDTLRAEVRKSGASSPWVPLEKVFTALPAHHRNWSNFERNLPLLFDNRLIELGEGGSSRKIFMRGKRYGLVRKR